MVDNKQFDDLKKQAERLNRDLENLGGTATKNINDFITSFGGGINGAQKAIGNLRNQIKDLDTDINYLTESLSKVVKELGNEKSFNKDIEKSFKKLSSLSNDLYNDQNRINTLSEKELKNIKKKIQLEGESLTRSLAGNKAEQREIAAAIERNEKLQMRLLRKKRPTNDDNKQYDNIAKELIKQQKKYSEINNSIKEADDFLNGELKSYKLLSDTAQARLKKEEEINNKLGISGYLVRGIADSLEKLGINSKFFEDIEKNMRDAADTAGSTKWKVFGTGIKSAWSGLKEGLKDPVTQLILAKKAFEFFLNAAFKANKESVNLSKNLGYGAANADRVRASFVDIESLSNNLNVTTANLSEAFNELSSATGFVTEYSADALETQIKLTKQLGLSGDEAAGIYELSILNGKSSEATYQSMLKGYVNTRNSLKVGVPFKAAIAEAAKVSGQLAANMGYNAEKIVSGVVATKALGTSLEQAKSQGASLLEFQSSIEDELQAELITGKQLNLERARAAALMGNQVEVAEELAAQGMTATEYGNMNVVAQNAYAKALGTTSNELANQLKKREVALASGKSLAEITAKEAEEATERQNIQEKFNAAMEKLQSLVGNLLAGPLGSFLEMLSGALDVVNKFITPLKIILGTYLAINTLKKISLGYDIASRANEQIRGNLGLARIGTTRIQGLLEKESLLTRIAGNIQLFSQLVAEKGVTQALRIQFGIQKATTATRQTGFLITLKDLVVAKAIAAFDMVRKNGVLALNALKTAGLVISAREGMISIANAAMTALKTSLSGIGSFLGPLAIPIGVAAAASVTALGYKLLKGNDIMSESGYGKRTLLAPEGAIRLNDKDTVIAGTNLGLNNLAKPETPQTPNKTDNLAKPETPQFLTINKTYNSFNSETPQTPNKTDNLVKPETPPTFSSLMGNLTIPPISINLPKESTDSEINKSIPSVVSTTTQPAPINSEINTPIKPSPVIQPNNPSINSVKNTQNNQPPALDLSPIVSVMNDVKSAIDYLNNKKWDVYLDSSRVGRGMVKGQTQSA
jgi:hypothetical protein